MFEKVQEWVEDTTRYFDETVECPTCGEKMRRGNAASVHGYGPLCPTCLRQRGEDALSEFLMEPPEDDEP